jgi:hypothetical protein
MTQNNKPITDSLKEKLTKKKETLILPNSHTISRVTAIKILEDIKNKYNLDNEEDALIPIAILSQKGATSSRCSGNMDCTYDSIVYKLSDIRKIFVANNAKNGIRKFARTYGYKIFEICQLLDIPGNMYTKVRRLHPNSIITKEDKYWVSDFQVYNESAPLEIRNLLIKSFSSTNKKK